jgi:thiopurine S-methyltransferase
MRTANPPVRRIPDGTSPTAIRGMHHEFWHERWKTGQIGFHQRDVHPFLARWWQALGVAPQSRVYVPLCGKSLDMVWLAERGHRVVGSELIPLAISEFFAERGLAPAITRRGQFRRHAAGPYEILEGDALALTTTEVGPVQAAYDRAALVALPSAMRRDYAASLERLLAPGAPALLVGFEYPQEMRGGPPFSIEADEVHSLFEPSFRLEQLERLDVIATNPKFAELGIPALFETAFRLTRT